MHLVSKAILKAILFNSTRRGKDQRRCLKELDIALLNSLAQLGIRLKSLSLFK